MTTPPLPSDRQLVDAARRGDATAWAEIVQRHRGAIEKVAGTGRVAHRRVAAAIATAEQRLMHAPVAPAEAAEIRATRPAMIASLTDGFFGPAWPGVLSADAENPAPPPSSDHEILAVAFASLPEPWQTVLWHHYVERDDDQAIAPFVGRSSGDVPELLATAQQGLTDAFFREYLASGPFQPEGGRIIPLLAGYSSGTLSEADRQLVADHLRLDHIAVAEAPAPAIAGNTNENGAPARALLAPPSLRRHDALDSRRLLELAASFDEELADAIAPGVLHSSGPAVPPLVAPIPPRTPLAEPVTASDGRGEPAGGVEPVTPPDDLAEPLALDDPEDPADSDHRRRRLLVIGGSLAVVALLIAALFIVGSGGDEAEVSSPTSVDGAVSNDPVGSSVPDETDPDVIVDEDDATTTTSLELRPPAEPPLSTISVVVDPVSESLGFAAAPATGPTVAASFPAPVLAGGSGTIDFDVTGTADVESLIGLTLQMPSGVRYEAVEGGECIDPPDDSPRCTVAVPAGETSLLSVRVLLENRVVGRLEVDGDLIEPVETPISVTPNLVHSSVGRGDVVVVGNTVTSCARVAAAAKDIDCDDVADGEGEVVDRWDTPIEFVGGDARFGLFNSSSAELVIPEGAEVVDARLFWAGDLDQGGQSIPDDGRNTTIALGLPGGEVRTIEAGRVVLGDVDASQYLGYNDVTELVQVGGAGSYTVGNVHTVEAQGSFGAWALVVVYDHAEAPRRQRLVTRPFEWVAPEGGAGETYVYAVDMPIPIDGQLPGEIDVFGLEGELGFAPESFLAGDQVLGGDNPFDSSIGTDDRVPSAINNLGVDIDTYALDIDASTGILPLRVTSENDGVRVAVLGLTVDLPS